MSTNIQGLIDRTYREYLEPMDDLQPYTLLTSGLTDSADTVSFNGDLLTQEEEDIMEAGSIIEIGTELMLCKALDTATTHSSGDTIKITPPFPRQVVFDAVKDQIKNLYPTLFATETQQITVRDGYTLLGSQSTPGTHNYLVAPIKAISQYTDFSAGADTTTVTYKGVAVTLVDLPNPFTYTNSSGTEETITYTSGPDAVKAVQFSGISAGHVAFVTFKKKFIDPTAESDTLATIGLEDEYEPIIMAGVAAQLIAGKDIPAATTDYISDQLAVSNFPVGSATSIRNSLLAYQNVLIEQARKDLRARFPEPVALNSIVYPAV